MYTCLLIKIKCTWLSVEKLGCVEIAKSDSGGLYLCKVHNSDTPSRVLLPQTKRFSVLGLGQSVTVKFYVTFPAPLRH